MKTIGIVAHSAEGAALCFLTACHEGAGHLGAFMHPDIVMSAVPMALSMEGWESGDHTSIARNLAKGVQQVADAGAGFFVCPDNTAHIVLEKIVHELPIPGLHIAEVVCSEIMNRGWTHAALLGTEWTMTGPVYASALARRGIACSIPDEPVRKIINSAIFDELCRGVFRKETTEQFVDCIEGLRTRGADCVILGCTEIPLIISQDNSPLPVLDSTRLLAKHAVLEAMSERPASSQPGWLNR